MLLNPVLGAEVCNDKTAKEVFKKIRGLYRDYVDNLNLFKQRAKSKTLTEDQVEFLRRSILSEETSQIGEILKLLRANIESINEHLQSGTSFGKRKAMEIMRKLCVDKELFVDTLSQFLQEMKGLKLTAAKEEQEFFPIAEEEEEDEVTVPEKVAIQSESQILSDLWNKRELADSLMREADRFFQFLTETQEGGVGVPGEGEYRRPEMTEEKQEAIPQNLRVKIASFLENYKDIVEVFEEQQKLAEKAKQDVMLHIARAEQFSQATLSSLVRLIYLYELLIAFGISAMKLYDEAKKTTTVACVILGSEEIDYDMIDTMDEIVLRLEEAV